MQVCAHHSVPLGGGGFAPTQMCVKWQAHSSLSSSGHIDGVAAGIVVDITYHHQQDSVPEAREER
jgi:hypothetical protein